MELSVHLGWLCRPGNGSEGTRKMFSTPETPNTEASHILKEKKEKKIMQNLLLGPVNT